MILKFKNEMPVRSVHAFPHMNDLFNNLFDGMVTNDFKRWTTPAVNIIENENQFKMHLAAPGLMKEDFKISINDGTLTVSAEKKEQSTETAENFTRKEFSFNGFSRSFALPEWVNIEAIAANYENGIMTVTLPKTVVAKPKVIEIKVG